MTRVYWLLAPPASFKGKLLIALATVAVYPFLGAIR